MELKLYNNITVGLVITGSFCTFKKIIAVIHSLKDRGMNVVTQKPYSRLTIDLTMQRTLSRK